MRLSPQLQSFLNNWQASKDSARQLIANTDYSQKKPRRTEFVVHIKESLNKAISSLENLHDKIQNKQLKPEEDSKNFTQIVQNLIVSKVLLQNMLGYQKGLEAYSKVTKEFLKLSSMFKAPSSEVFVNVHKEIQNIARSILEPKDNQVFSKNLLIFKKAVSDSLIADLLVNTFNTYGELTSNPNISSENLLEKILDQTQIIHIWEHHAHEAVHSDNEDRVNYFKNHQKFL